MSDNSPLSINPKRLYYLDWLRVIAFSLLILYHAGLMFVDWGYHIQNETLSEELKKPMLFLNQWRLPLLFFISGVGIKFSFKKRSTVRFIKERFSRLFIPLIAGIIIVVPWQVYFERLYKGEFQGSYFEFYSEFYNGIYPQGNFMWSHLWFLAYLLTFVIILLPIFNILRSDAGIRRIGQFAKWLTKPALPLVLFSIPLVLIELTLREDWPDNRMLIGDWYNVALYLTILLYGYLIASSEILWQVLERDRWIYLVVGLLSFSTIYFGWHQPEINFLETSPFGYYVFHSVKMINVVAWILVCLGFAKKYLSQPGRYLAYANQSVYPVFILHQTMLIGLGYYVLPLNFSILLKLLVLIVGTFALSLAFNHWVVLKFALLRTIFGVKKS